MATIKFGYKVVYAPNHPKANNKGYIYEHVANTEKMLGRYMTDEETIHHIDRNKKNNNIDNLMIFASNSDHASYHGGGQAWSNDGIIWHTSRKAQFRKCPTCGKIFSFNKGYSKDKKYCCSKCAFKRATYKKENKVVSTTTKEKIKVIQNLLYENNGNFSAVGRILGCSSSGISKLLKKNGIKNHSKDYKTA